jgi:hypothetical protein
MALVVASRCITYMMEYIPNSIPIIVENGAIEHFCAHLFNIEYIDLAEQAIQVHPPPPST